MKICLVYPIAAIVLASCGGPEFVDTSKLPDTYQCTYMQDICKDAREFERTYNALPAQERKEAENVLKAYRLQCNDALETCKKSAPPSQNK